MRASKSSARCTWAEVSAHVATPEPQVFEQRPVSGLRGVGPALAEKLAKLGVTQVQDLLFVLPSRYEDRTQISEIGSVRPGVRAVVEGDFEKEAARVFENIQAVITASGGTFRQVVKVTIFLTDFANFAKVNELMASYFKEPYPARSTVAVAALPRNARVEIECTLHLG